MNGFCTPALRFLSVLCVAGLVLGASGKASAQNRVFAETAGQATVYAAQGVAGDDLILTLETSPSTGFEWQVGPVPPCVRLRERELTAPQLPQNGVALAGAPRQERFVFRALAPGQGTVTLSYRRLWEKDTPPVRHVICLVDVR